MKVGAKKDNRFQINAKAIITLILVFALFLYPSFILAESASQKRAEVSDLENQMKQQQDIIARKQAESNTLADEILVFNAQIKEIELQIKATQLKIQDVEEQIQTTEKQISQKERELAELKKTMEESLRIIYEEGSRSKFEVIISSGTLSEALDRTEYLDAVENKIETTMDEINKLKAELIEKKSNLEDRKKELATLAAQQKATKLALAEQRVAKDQLLASTRGEESRYQKLLIDTKEEYAEAQSELAQMERGSSGGGSAGYPSVSGFYWPLNGRVTMRFCGYRTPSGGCHSGLDISDSHVGTPIRATKDGVVIEARNGCRRPGNTFRGEYCYGNFVKVDHGGGWITVYAHLSAFGAGVGTRVTGGQSVIGYEGNTGYSSGVHLHFEIRYNNTPLDPLRFLP